MYSASALAANAMIRSAAGAVFPLFTDQMFHHLGVQWAGTLIGCIALLLAPSPFIFYRYGAWIRTKSTFAPCLVSLFSARAWLANAVVFNWSGRCTGTLCSRCTFCPLFETLGILIEQGRTLAKQALQVDILTSTLPKRLPFVEESSSWGYMPSQAVQRGGVG